MHLCDEVQPANMTVDSLAAPIDIMGQQHHYAVKPIISNGLLAPHHDGNLLC